MTTLIEPIADGATQRSTASSSDQLCLIAHDGRELDQMIELHQCQGWILVCRSYSLERGHRAKLIRGELAKAA